MSLDRLNKLSVEDRRKLSYKDPLLDDYAAQVEQRYGLPTGILTTIKNAGERSQSHQVSPKGARGVMQFMPPAQKQVGLQDPTDPLQAIDAAGKYVRYIIDTRKTQDPALLMAAYNAGPFHPDIKAGRVPSNKETSQYVQRGLAYMAENKRTPQGPLSVMADYDEKGKKGREAAKWIPKPADRPVDLGEGNTLVLGHPFGPERFDTRIPVGKAFNRGMIGAGKKIMDTGYGLAQAAGNVSQDEIDERAVRDQPILQDTAGLLGYIGGGVGEAYLGGRALGPFGQSLRGRGVSGGSLGSAGGLRSALTSPLAMTGYGGAMQAGAQPVLSGESRLGNSAVGAALPMGSTATVAGVKRLGAPISQRVSGEYRKALEFAEANGIPMRGYQLDKNPAVQSAYRLTGRLPGAGHDAANETQMKAFTRAVTRTFGEDVEDLAEGLASAKIKFDRIYPAITSKYDMHITTGDEQAVNEAIKRLGTKGGDELKAWWDLVLADYRQNGGALPGALFQKHREYLYSLKDSYGANAKPLQDVATMFNGAMQRSIMDPADWALWKETDHLYNNWKTVGKVAKDAMRPESQGTVDPRRLYEVMMGGGGGPQATNRNAMVLGSAVPVKQDLANLTQFGNKYLAPVAQEEKQHMRDLARNAGHFALAPLASGAAGWGFGALTGHADPWAMAALTAGSTMVGGATLGRAMNRPATEVAGQGMKSWVPTAARDATAGLGATLGVLPHKSAPRSAAMAGKQAVGPDFVPQPGDQQPAGFGEPVPDANVPEGLGAPVPDDALPR